MLTKTYAIIWNQKTKMIQLSQQMQTSVKLESNYKKKNYKNICKISALFSRGKHVN